MKFWTELLPGDARLIEQLDEFLPTRIFDIHAHLFSAKHCSPERIPPAFDASSEWNLQAYFSSMAKRLPGRKIEGLLFGYPSRLVDREAANGWVAAEASNGVGKGNRGLAVVSPEDDPAAIRKFILENKFIGLKPYHVFASGAQTMDAKVEDFAPDWMWEICHEIQGVLMLHIVRDRAIADAENIASLLRLCRAYPRCRLVLAHIARSFNYRHALEGLAAMKDLPNVVVDTALVTEPEAIRFAIQTLGPERVLYGSDFPFSELRGKCTSVGDGFAWIYADELPATGISKIGEFTLMGIESLLCVRDACEACGLNAEDVRGIFLHNAQKVMGI